MDRWNSILDGWRRHERRWIGLYLSFVLVAAVILGVPQTRSRFLATVGRAVDVAEERWDARVRHGLGLVEAGDYEEAARYLERLDAEFPAPTSRARRDRQREALLIGLATSYEALGRRGRTIATYERLAAFDARDYQNHYRLATAHLRLARGWAVPEEAHASFEAALSINPNHLPSVRAVMRFTFDRGDFTGTIAAFERYMNATLRENVRIVMGDSVAIIRAPVDGRWHGLAVSVPHPQPDSIVLLSDGYAVEAGPARFALALEVGVLPPGPPTVTGPSMMASGFDRTDSGRLVPLTTNTRMVFPVPASSTPVTEMILRISLFKPVDSETWSMATRSYHNLLDDSGVARALTRVQPIPLTLADSIVPFYLD